jgi:hypothetical protein
MKKFLSIISGLILAFAFVTTVSAASPWDGWVHAPLKTAQPYDWSAPDGFFTGKESGSIKYLYTNDSFEGELELSGFEQAGPYVLTVDTADGDSLAGYGCGIWKFWAGQYGQTFVGGTNGCWNGSPYADVELFTLEPYTVVIDSVEHTYYKGTIPFNVPLLEGTYNLKFFVKLDWNLTSPFNNIMMMNDMTGDSRYGKVVQPKVFIYDTDLIISAHADVWFPGAILPLLKSGDYSTENLILANEAWCAPSSCQVPSADSGYQGTTGVVFYKTVSSTFEGVVVLSNTVTPPTPQSLQIKLEGLGSLSADAASNENIGYIGRWWDNSTSANINDTQYEALKTSHNVLGYVIFDGFDTSTTYKTFALNHSYHVLWTDERGAVSMPTGDYKAIFALTENTLWWRGVFLSENPVEFTIE